MRTLETLMTPAPVTISPGATLRDAVDLLTSVGVNALPVTIGEHVIGLLSSQAIIAFEAGTPGVPTERDVTDALDEPAISDEDLPSVEYFAELWDDAGSDVVERFRTSETPEWDMLAEHTVEEAMTRAPPELPPTASVRAAARLMRITGSHGVLVVDQGKLRGIVTTMDIARLVSRDKRGG
ncbi:MAG TPA: CBS domain-containing protein [Gemmatimonadaceae bacterium]|jgi:CBS domain-containing protein